MGCSGAGKPAPEAAGGPEKGAAPPATEEPAAPEVAPGEEGPVTVMATDVRLSPAARVQAEKYMCVCGCEMVLAECTCGKEPGGISMKKHLQKLVDDGLTPREVSEDMVKAYGAAVLR